eukprot:334700-Pelagomonas_calceolata.AAC.1
MPQQQWLHQAIASITGGGNEGQLAFLEERFIIHCLKCTFKQTPGQQWLRQAKASIAGGGNEGQL